MIERFQVLYEESPREATDWYYKFSQDTNYIRRDRIVKDMQWKAPTEYGELDITINGSPWFLQYSPYVYYICLNSQHVPMKIDRACFGKLLDFVRQFSHYFVGSNADLPIVGGSILAHDHFQGGHYTFAMEKATVETLVTFPVFEDVTAGVVKWPMSVVRIACENPARLKEELAAVADTLVTGADLRADELTEKHADWAESFAKNYTITKDNALDIVQKEIGLVFAQVLEHAGVYKRSSVGKQAFALFLKSVK